MITEDGRHFKYICPNCGMDVEGCPDPACQSEGVGHHADEKGNPTDGLNGCDYDVKMADCAERFTGKIDEDLAKWYADGGRVKDINRGE